MILKLIYRKYFSWPSQWGEILLQRSIPNLMQLHFYEILLKCSCSEKIPLLKKVVDMILKLIYRKYFSWPSQWGEILLQRSIPNLMQLHFYEILLKCSCSEKIPLLKKVVDMKFS